MKLKKKQSNKIAEQFPEGIVKAVFERININTLKYKKNGGGIIMNVPREFSKALRKEFPKRFPHELAINLLKIMSKKQSLVFSFFYLP